MSLKEQIKLTKANLDEVAILLPQLFDDWGESWAQAYAERDRAKENLSAVKAKADEEIRKDPKKFGLVAEKPTEVWIAAKVLLHPDVVAAGEALITAQYNLNMIVVGKETLEHTEKSLNILADLFRNSYFVARSRLDSDYTDKDTDKARDTQNEALQNEGEGRRRRRKV
jgi:hypothetical protein